MNACSRKGLLSHRGTGAMALRPTAQKASPPKASPIFVSFVLFHDTESFFSQSRKTYDNLEVQYQMS